MKAILVAVRIVLRRCAITMVVRFCLVMISSSAACTMRSLSLSRALVASSSSSTDGLRTSARDRHALLLAARELAAADADVGLVAVLQALDDEGVRVGVLCRLLHLLEARVALAVANVLFHGALEEHRLLRDEAELLPQPVHIEGREVD